MPSTGNDLYRVVIFGFRDKDQTVHDELFSRIFQEKADAYSFAAGILDAESSVYGLPTSATLQQLSVQSSEEIHVSRKADVFKIENLTEAQIIELRKGIPHSKLIFGNPDAKPNPEADRVYLKKMREFQDGVVNRLQERMTQGLGIPAALLQEPQSGASVTLALHKEAQNKLAKLLTLRGKYGLKEGTSESEDETPPPNDVA